MSKSFEERANLLTLDEYVRVYAYFDGLEEAERHVSELFAWLRENPHEDLILDPKLIAVAALFSDTGKRLAAVWIGDAAEIARLQLEAAGQSASLREEFQHLAG